MYFHWAVLLVTATLSCVVACLNVSNDTYWYTSEIAFIADLKSRVTGSPNHNKLIDHIQSELDLLGVQVYSDVLNFTYNNEPLSPLKLTVDGKELNISSSVPYSGNTNATGVSGKLVNLISPAAVPNWTEASGSIAVVNITNVAVNGSTSLPPWPGQPAWGPLTGVPDGNAEVDIRNLTQAADADVHAVIYTWENISTGNAYGQYVPFHLLYQVVPTIFVARDAAESVLQGAQANATAHVVLKGELVNDTSTRSIWAVFPGTAYPNESIIISTHTDGVNALEENGYIALLAKAKDLHANPPQRTTIVLFVSGHMHIPAFAPAAGAKATTRWLADNPGLWAGEPGQMKAVFGSCVEHMGAVFFREDLAVDVYYPIPDKQAEEWLYAGTTQLVSLVEQQWRGATPKLAPITNPNTNASQSGEGSPFVDNKIPNVSLVTSPPYLLAEFPKDFDERQLINVPAMARQIDSFMRIWAAFDRMAVESFGVVPPTGGL